MENTQNFADSSLTEFEEARPTSLSNAQLVDQREKNDNLKFVHSYVMSNVANSPTFQAKPNATLATPLDANSLQTIMMSVFSKTPIPTVTQQSPTAWIQELTKIFAAADVKKSQLSSPLANPEPLTPQMAFAAVNSIMSNPTASVPTNLVSEMAPITQIAAPLPVSNQMPINTASTSEKINRTPPMRVEKYDNSSDDGISNLSRCSSRNRTEDMSNSNEDQNKLERKRARNREAASKCRQKKIDRIKELECQVNMEKSREAKLMDEQKQLTNIFSRLQEVLNEHKRVGCGL